MHSACKAIDVITNQMHEFFITIGSGRFNLLLKHVIYDVKTTSKDELLKEHALGPPIICIIIITRVTRGLKIDAAIATVHAHTLIQKYRSTESSDYKSHELAKGLRVRHVEMRVPAHQTLRSDDISL